MTKFEVLNQIENKTVTPKAGYLSLFDLNQNRKPKKSRFIKAKIKIPEQKGINLLLSVLLILPVPICIIKWIVKKRANIEINNHISLKPNDFIDLISIKGVLVTVETKSREKIILKTI